MSEMFKRIDTVFLQVRDFDKAIDWYSTVLGFLVRWRFDQGGYAALEVGETPLTIVRSESHMPFNFYVSDIAEAHHHLLQHDVKTGPIQDDGSVKWFEFEDPDGNKLGVCHISD